MGKKKNGFWQKFKKHTKTFLKWTATALSIGINPKGAGDDWRKKILKDTADNSIRKELKEQFICKYIFITPVSNPATVICGHGERIVWREGISGDLYIKDLDRPFHTPIALDNNMGFPMLFDSEDNIRKYLKEQLEAGKIRKGSYILTSAGAYELGSMILDSVTEYISDREEDPISIPRVFLDILTSAKHQLIMASRKEIKLYGYDPTQFAPKKYLNKVSSLYPFEFNLVIYILNYVFSMQRLAVFYESQQQDEFQV